MKRTRLKRDVIVTYYIDTDNGTHYIGDYGEWRQVDGPHLLAITDEKITDQLNEWVNEHEEFLTGTGK